LGWEKPYASSKGRKHYDPEEAPELREETASKKGQF